MKSNSRLIVNLIENCKWQMPLTLVKTGWFFDKFGENLFRS